jgi:hypothetical protein
MAMMTADARVLDGCIQASPTSSARCDPPTPQLHHHLRHLGHLRFQPPLPG